MTQSKWWKCDLQVATPAWHFKFPPDSNYRLKDANPNIRVTERIRFLDDYMLALRAKEIDVIALADHNTGEWIDDAKAAGARHGVCVFPGCEITTNTGADGVHLLIIGDRDKTSQDFDRLLHGIVGFSDEFPRYRLQGVSEVPTPASKTLEQILNKLPDGYLAIAPHALSDNGIASKDTVRGDLRWKALHHERLVALDPGDCSNPQGDSFGARFKRREANDFPRLPDMAFVATSDAYAIADLGKRYTWIRMGEPTIEALRQACLDHESRILCDWAPALANFPERNPNNIRHSWISSIELGGTLTNSMSPLSLNFHPGLNVIIGGRGSGKSSVVSALRQLYSSSESLPTRLKSEVEEFSATVFAEARLISRHRIQESQVEQTAEWSLENGSTTNVDGQRIPTTFFATVINQKELFERAAGDKNDPHLTSRSLLALVDASAFSSNGFGFNFGASFGNSNFSSNSFSRKLDDARAHWGNEHRTYVLLKHDLAQLPALKSRSAILEGQVQAFAASAVKERLATIESRQQEHSGLETRKAELKETVEAIQVIASTLSKQVIALDIDSASLTPSYAALAARLNAVTTSFSDLLSKAATTTTQSLSAFEEEVNASEWSEQVRAAEADLQSYKEELSAQGLSPAEFSRLQEELNRSRETIRQLEEKESKLEAALAASTTAWQAILTLFQQRREARQELFSSIELRSGRLRFSTEVFRDADPWIETVRAISTLRSDGFVEETKKLATWLWNGDPIGLEERIAAWQAFLTDKDSKEFQRVTSFRLPFLERLASVEESARLRIATQLPDDVVGMKFLRENGKPQRDGDWQSVSQGSPGQRTAAMLAFVLHHGREPLVLDQPEDDLDSEWISKLVVKELRQSRWHRQLIVVSHNANIPVLGDAEQVIALENKAGSLCVRTTEEKNADGSTFLVPHIGPVEEPHVRRDIQSIMEGGVIAFVRREQKYNNETRAHKVH